MIDYQNALEGVGTSISRYQRVYDYAQAFELEVWGRASAGAWDRLEFIAQEYERGEYAWERAAALVDDTVKELYV